IKLLISLSKEISSFLLASDGEECVMVKQHRIDADCSSDTPTAYPDRLGSPSHLPSKSSPPIGVPIPAPGTASLDNSSPRRPSSLLSEAATEGEPAVLDITNHVESTSLFDESPPPTIHRPDL
ncbi:WD repeat domain phosphoinositide-interacting protein 2, partial [Caligus rogercresseyi]